MVKHAIRMEHLVILRHLLKVYYNKRHVLDMIQHFTVFIPGQKTIKMLPAYHQFFAVQKAYTRALTASADDGDGRGGLMWHTQGAGKSFEMACLAGMLATSKALKNPTIVVVTDRKNLDHQLFDTFVAAKALMRQDPEMADSREEIKRNDQHSPCRWCHFYDHSEVCT
jgi:type I restriction enzyme, R subunit